LAGEGEKTMIRSLVKQHVFILILLAGIICYSNLIFAAKAQAFNNSNEVIADFGEEQEDEVIADFGEEQEGEMIADFEDEQEPAKQNLATTNFETQQIAMSEKKLLRSTNYHPHVYDSERQPRQETKRNYLVVISCVFMAGTYLFIDRLQRKEKNNT
jgi:hypothetical protein